MSIYHQDYRPSGTNSNMSHVIDQSVSMSTAGATNNNVKVAAGYVLGERLGSGSFATVYKGIRLADYEQAINSNEPRSSAQLPSNSTSSTAAIKVISRASKKLTKKVLENLDMEIAILRTYRHPNIVCLHEAQKTERHFYLVLEYCGGGDLQRLIRTRKSGRLSERLCRRLVRDLSAGLGFLWGKELVHRDIKPQNLLLTGPLPPEEEVDNPAREDANNAMRGVTGERFMLKIADFGFARHLAGVDLAETMCGSPLYMAPEILVSVRPRRLSLHVSFWINSYLLFFIWMNPHFPFYVSKSGEKYSAKADLWSVGSVLFEMVAGVTPFHGENHLDLLRNIKTKAVRLPSNVRISREFVNLLKLLLDRKPHSRADFTTFFEASEALVALGCNGAPAVPPSIIEKSTSTQMSTLLSSSSGQRIVERDVCIQMNLCAISENEGTVESHHQGNARLSTVATSESANSNHVHQPQSFGNIVPSMATSKWNAMNVMVHVRPDHMNKPGVVTPPLNHVSATQPPPAHTYGLPGAGKQNGARPSIFAPLQGSPNLSPCTPQATFPNPPMFLLGGVSNDACPRPILHSQPKSAPHQIVQQQRMIGHPTYVNGADRKNSSPKVSCHESSDSEFVMVEHSSWQSKPGSGRNSPSTSIGGITHSVSCSPRNSSSRVTILDARKNMGMLGTSPGTGRALFGKMMMGSPAQSTVAPATTFEGGRFDLSPRAALSNGGCLAHIDVLVRMLSASEDIGRRAITVAHLGDMRAYLGMGLLVTLKEESQSSSMSTGTSMEGVDDERSTDICNAKRIPFGKSVPEEGDDDDEEEELPFAMTTSSDGGSGENISDPSTQNVNIAKSSEHIETRGESASLPMIHLHFREALMCYFKALTMMKVSITAFKKVTKEVDEVLHQSLSVNIATTEKNPYTPLKIRCSASLEWLSGQFSAVLERADAASDQISKLQKASSTRLDEGEESQVCVEELIYNHSLKCGRGGAVKQILGHYDEARSCFRSAGLLAETLLMESKVVDEDRIVLEGYVNSFTDQIITLDGLIRVEMRKSRGVVSLLQSQENRGDAPTGSRPPSGDDQKN